MFRAWLSPLKIALEKSNLAVSQTNSDILDWKTITQPEVLGTGIADPLKSAVLSAPAAHHSDLIDTVHFLFT
jgi:hypothetical protein